MGKIIRTLLLGGALLGLAFFALNSHEETVTNLEYDLQVSRLRAQYVERAGWVRSVPTQERYRDELTGLNKWFDAAWTDLHNRFPGRGAPDAVAKELEAEAAKPGAKAEEIALRKEFYTHTKEFYDLLATGRYIPLQTNVVSGVRIDLLDFKQVAYEGKNTLRVDAVVWGAPRRELVQKVDGKAALVKTQLDFAFSALSLEFVDEKDKLLGGGDTGAPTLMVDSPERWIGPFPPQAAIATWYIEAFPAETKDVLLKIDGEIRSPSAGAFPVNLEYRLPAKASWKLGAGEFKGDERLMPEEEMDRSAGN